MSETMRLIRCIQKSGDRAAADMLVRIYYDEIHRFVRKQISDDNSALDLTQDIFISMLKTIGGYDEKKGAGFRTWLYKIATNKTIDYFRSKTANLIEVLSIDDIEPIDETDFTLRFEDSDFTYRVCDYVNVLLPDTQRIFRLHIFGGYTFREIAESLRLPESSVKTKYYRLINILRKEFGSYDR